MKSNLVPRTSSLIQKLDNNLQRYFGAKDKNNPYYWYYYLNNLGKAMQNKEMVEAAIDGFRVDNQEYQILSVVSKRFLTYDLCKDAVCRNGYNLRYVPDKYLDANMCISAVVNNGDALIVVPQEILLGDEGYEICFHAVQNDFGGSLLSCIPQKYLEGEKGLELYKAAVSSNGHAIKYVPKEQITEELATLAIKAPIQVREVPQPNGAILTLKSDDPIVKYLPNNFLSKELVSLAAKRNPKSLSFVPVEYISRELCIEIIAQDPMNLKYIPRQFQDKEMVNYALTIDPKVLSVVPPNLLTVDLCQEALRRDPNISIEDLPEHIIEKLSSDFRPKNFINYKPIKLNPPSLSHTDGQLVSANERRYPKNLSSGDGPNKKFYYVTDLHLEHQLVEETEDITKLSLSEIKSRIDRKTSELVSSVSADYHSTLLIGGDVADSIKLEALFYKQLTLKWPGNIISVLGNHELWDGDLWGTKKARPIDKIIDDYRKSLPLGTSLLENQLLIYYKGLHKEILDESDILRASTKELTEVCNRSSIIVLGGIGFSGLNPVYNATAGLYRSSVSREEDILRSQRFRSVYEKVLASAKDIPVIVLTHMPMRDWSDASYNPRWIYVNGHTHQNSRLLDRDGTSVFSDNQIGYTPKVWRLKTFIIDVQRYDPFKDYSDGIHQISRDQYVDFNRCQGIAMDSIKYPGDVFVIKYDINYMFVIKNLKSLYLLEGGRRHKLDRDIDYYFENLPLYIKKVRNAFMPYQNAISMLSNEVKKIGGSGKVHGCIVDIDFFNHVYLNPFDGKISPYFALDTTNKVFFKDIKSLLNSSTFDNKRILRKYLSMSQKGKIPILTHKEYHKQELTAMSEIVLDRSMYEPSRIMRSIQYIFDQNVLRVWKDEVLSISETSPKEMLPNSKKLS